MPIRDDDQFFFIGDGNNDSSDKRFRKMGTLYIFQIGQATKFDGTPLTEELSAGALNIEWSCTFMNPQLQSLVRVYDGVTEKDVYRVINDINWYRAYTRSSSHNEVFQNTRFRHLTWTLDKDLFTEQGDYVILSLPTPFSITRAVKSINSVALPHTSWTGKPYGMTMYDAVAAAKLTVQEVGNFLQQAFKFAQGAITVAKEIYDVASLISSVFVLNLKDEVSESVIDDPTDTDITHSRQSLPLGQCIVHYDGINSPVIEDYIEFQDHEHAIRSNYNFDVTKFFVAFKVKRGNNDLSSDKVLPTVPYLRKIDNA
jgi:hypothetical protein